MFSRSSHSKNTLPQPNTALIKHRNEIMEKTRRLFSSSSSRSSQRKLSTALFTTTSRTNNQFFKPQSQQDNYHRFLNDNPRPESPLRPFSSQSSQCHRAQSPLSVVRTRSKILSNQLNQAQSNTLPKKTRYLKRGSSVDKAIIHNVLKSKFNQNVCNPAFSYCDHEQNRDLVNIIASQIPKGIRDVVGVQQMLRMSHIFTGTQFKNNNLTTKVKIALSEAKAHLHHGEDEDNLTLKSIKRW